jgi:serine/threonine-protein kinase
MTAHYNEPAARTREVFRAALELRSGLSSRDQALLDALEPLLGRDPPQGAEAAERMKRLADGNPLDAELAILPTSFAPVAREEKEKYCGRAVAVDPDFADARQCLGQAKLERGDTEGARAEFAECLRRAPTAMDCAMEGLLLARRLGQCDQMETAARAWTGRDPASTTGYLFFVAALASQDVPRDAVVDAIRLFVARQPAAQQFEKDHWLAMLAVLHGDFSGARAALDALAKSVTDNPNLDAHVRHDLVEAELLVETGQDAAAAKTATEFTSRKRVWMRNANMDMHVWAPFGESRMLAIAGTVAGSATLEKRRAERDAWAAWAKPLLRPVELWAFGDAAFVESSEDAQQALKSMPNVPADPILNGRTPPVLALAGRTLLLAGRHAEAAQWLKSAAVQCDALPNPFENTRAHLWLGQALEAAGDAKGACAPYRIVVDRWGKAKPASVSAREAATRMKAIGCP